MWECPEDSRGGGEPLRMACENASAGCRARAGSRPALGGMQPGNPRHAYAVRRKAGRMPLVTMMSVASEFTGMRMAASRGFIAPATARPTARTL